MDRDFDGKLSFEEFMGEETPLERLFRSMDKDGDGTVTKEVTKFYFCHFYTPPIVMIFSFAKGSSHFPCDIIREYE